MLETLTLIIFLSAIALVAFTGNKRTDDKQESAKGKDPEPKA